MKSNDVLIKYGKMAILFFGTFIAGILVALLFSFLGALFDHAFLLDSPIDPSAIGYMAGSIFLMPLGALLLFKLIYKKSAKYWQLLIGSLGGFGLFLLYFFFIHLQQVLNNPSFFTSLFTSLFHLLPFALTLLFGIVFLPKFKKPKDQNPETEE